ncbi:dihydroxyacetone kinase subunit DhaL [Anoxynatronum sibiricum]|uniref:Dihydroxyacetone kinase subunit DhaL n=1 Tax=Anoxynatronum sibiricum TaxID=210623 RepID=A0ABU9VSR3_9CLOT
MSFQLKLTNEQYLLYLVTFMKKLEKEKDYITQLDSVTGDGDHWVNMDMGFRKLIDQKSDLEALTFGEMFKKIGMTIMSTVGGSSGVLYGSGYIRAAQTVGDVQELDATKLADMLQAFLNAIMERGKAKPGDKTMIDTLHGGVESMRQKLAENADDAAVLQALKSGALAGMESTKEMEAAKGRAYYQTNKGVGNLDPGAVTMYYQIEALVDVLMSDQR